MMDEKVKSIRFTIEKDYPNAKTELEKRLLVAKEMKRMMELEIEKLEQLVIHEKIKSFTM